MSASQYETSGTYDPYGAPGAHGAQEMYGVYDAETQAYGASYGTSYGTAYGGDTYRPAYEAAAQASVSEPVLPRQGERGAQREAGEAGARAVA
ncbi:hypothetical protein ABT404_07850, partial [Streptomyces hyaluromycini]